MKMPSPRRLAQLLGGLWLLVVTYLPGDFGAKLRDSYYRPRLKHLGQGVLLDVGVQISQPELVSIGDHTWIDKYVIILAGPAGHGERKMARKENPSFTGAAGEVLIGRDCHIAPFSILVGHGGISIGNSCGVASGSRLYSLSHHYRNPLDPSDRFMYSFTPMVPECEQALYVGPVVMEDNTCLALNSSMLPGSTIGRNSWVGVSSVVLEAIPADSIAAGNPAKLVKSRL